jgi:predicted metal-binding membrane protein
MASCSVLNWSWETLSNWSWLGAAIFVTAGVYQLTSYKDVCLRHCRSPMSLLLHYTSFRGPAIDLRVGFHHGLYCVACCWGLMLILVAVGVMNIPAMVALTIVIFAEKLLRHGLLIARLIGISFFGTAVVAVIFPNLFPGLKPCCTPLPCIGTHEKIRSIPTSLARKPWR